ncbi:MAG TPA: aminoacyl-tRNA hydrolase [Thermotogota bacterium]|nr:aminoacyl-tRNA hydrolase [Thermotogota bacterium]HPJ88692.1 aminoacyl-tRNA hydrolase [Thermotogota bacterium]HPR95959.1 aminoacyl-tRNA hydrolase [Thermotogota bacterium]
MKKLAFFGLGNPGPQYAFTRHNAGFLTIDRYLRYNSMYLQKEEQKKNYSTYQLYKNNVRLYLIKPMTYMNLSGIAVKEFCIKNGIAIDDIFIIFDDVSLPMGKIRLRLSGSDGGQKGMRSIMQEMNTDSVKRIKIGIGPKDIPSLPDFVLSKFKTEEQDKLEWALEKAVAVIDDLIEKDFSKILNIYNGLSADGD